MADEGNIEIPQDLATPTNGFQDRPLAFRVTHPLAERLGLEPREDFSPRLSKPLE